MNWKEPVEERFPAREYREPPRNERNFTNGGAPCAGYGSVPPELDKNVRIAKDLIERCMQLYMIKEQVITTVLEQVGIEPSLTSRVWDQLTRENEEFFEEYYKKIILIDQIEKFNRLVEQYQCQLQNNNQNISYSDIEDFSFLIPPSPPTHQHGHGFVDSLLQFPHSSSGHLQRSTVSSYHNEDPASNSPELAQMNNGGGMAMDSNAADRTPYFGNYNLTETSYFGAKDRRPWSTSSLPPPVEKQGQTFTQKRGQHFMEQQGPGSSELTGAQVDQRLNSPSTEEESKEIFKRFSD